MTVYLKLDHWKNTYNFIKWVKAIEKKSSCIFMQIDIAEFYLSITTNILDSATTVAKQLTNITKKCMHIIKHCRKSLLYDKQQ